MIQSACAMTSKSCSILIGELPSSITGGLGGAIFNFNQYYSLQPANLWATNVVAAGLGIAFFLAVVAAERLLARRAPEHVACAWFPSRTSRRRSRRGT